MTSIISTGIGSGLDISGIVQQLVNAEGAPVETRLAQREATAQSKLSAFGGLKSALADFKAKAEAIESIDKILARKAASEDETIFTVSAESGAAPASYDLEVVRLATAHKLSSGSFTDSSTAVGTGTLTLSLGSESMSLVFDSSNNTLSNIRDAINNASDNPGISATIVNADAGSYLILTGENTGQANQITVTQTGGDGGLSALEYDPDNSLLSLTESTAAEDALIRIDGLDVMNATNTFTDAIESVTISLLQDSSGATQRLTVENDNDEVTNRITQFIDSYNSLINLTDALNSYDQETNAAGALIGDATLRGIVTQIRNEMNTSVTGLTGPFSLLTDIGVELQVDGKFEVDGAKLKDALDTDFVRVGQLFTASDGYASRIITAADNFLDSDGILEARTDGLNSQIDRIGDQRERLNDRLVSLEARLLRQYNALDTLLSELNNTSNFLNSQLQNLPGFTRPGNS